MTNPIIGQSHDHIASTISAIAILATFAGWLPPLAALGAVIWYGCLITSWIVNKGWRAKK